VFGLMLARFVLLAVSAATHVYIFGLLGAGAAVTGGWLYFKGMEK
jgi:hypothetical protein